MRLLRCTDLSGFGLDHGRNKAHTVGVAFLELLIRFQELQWQLQQYIEARIFLPEYFSDVILYTCIWFGFAR